MSKKGEKFIKMMRGREAIELMKSPNTFTLLALIAMRARRTEEFNLDNLKPGQALIGDHKALGLTRGQYRHALNNLRSNQIVTTKATNKGTVVTIINTMIFDPNIKYEQPSEQPDNNHPDNQTTTTNKNVVKNVTINGVLEIDFSKEVEYLYSHYRDTLRPSVTLRSKKNIATRLGQGYSWKNLKAAIDNYALEVREVDTQRKYIIQAQNFFGQKASFKDYLPSAFKRPPSKAPEVYAK